MKRIILLALSLTFVGSALAQDSQVDRIKHHLFFLASDSLQGRRAGSEDARKAADYLVAQYAEMGVSPLFDDYLLPFSTRQSDDMISLGLSMMGDTAAHYRNIAVVIPGNDPQLRHEYIIFGAHYDHLGVKKGEVYNGADDNASGSAAMIELARQLKARQKDLRRSIIIVNFDAEEIGLVGSGAFASLLSRNIASSQLPEIWKAIPPKSLTDSKTASSNICPIDYCRLMLSIDMVGYLRQSGKLVMEGSGTFEEARHTLQGVAGTYDIPLHLRRFESSPITATDTEPFAKRGKPTLAVTTGLKSPYHKPGDDPELIDYEGLSRITDFLANLAVELSTVDKLESTGHLASKHSSHLPAFEAGITLAGGRDWLQFPTLALTTDAGWGWHGGASFIYNFNEQNGHWYSIHTGIFHDRVHTPYPSESDFWGTQGKFHQEAIQFPIDLRLNFGTPSTSLYLGLGAYHNHFLHAKFGESGLSRDVKASQWGWLFSFGLKIGRLDLGAEFYNGIGSIMNPTKTILSSSRVSLTYWLW